jgi:hypothetical protein
MFLASLARQLARKRLLNVAIKISSMNRPRPSSARRPHMPAESPDEGLGSPLSRLVLLHGRAPPPEPERPVKTTRAVRVAIGAPKAAR